MLIFDMDGTLINSNGIWRTVDETFLARRGLPYTREYYEGVAHTVFPKAAAFTKAYCRLTESEEEIMAEWMELAGDMYATSVDVKPGVLEYLRKCRDAGETMIVLTSSVPTHCRTALEHLDLLPHFDRILIAQELG
ncbi:MAG: HAD family phosphatase, partial [Oscillospiraceae bacterium]|nr:HAD family phosphatase [Oscillospiraceae bacterium]